MTNRASLDQSTVVAPREKPDASRPEASGRLRELFDMHSGYVWNTLRRLGVRPGDLEDLTHDVFLHVQRHLYEYDETRPAKPWLFGFAFRIASQYRRRAHRWREVPSDAPEGVDPTALADAQIAAAQDRQLVLEALECVDLDRRAVFVLYEIDGVSMDEIARFLGIPVNTAYSRLRAARADFAAAAKRLRARRGER